MLSRFFLKRPVFAWVIAIIIMAGGGLAIYNLPISQYPAMAPPSIAISSYYPGASAETVENSVTQIIEQKMTGFDNLLYMSSISDSAGASRVELTFKAGTDPDLAWSQVQNKLQLAMSSLPDTIKSQGVQVSKSTRNYLMIVGLVSENGSMDNYDLTDYAKSNLEKVLARVPGVGEVEIFGGGYAMRVWLDPLKLNDYHLTIEDVITAIKMYNVEVSAGQFGGAPAVKGQRLNASIVVQNMLSTPDEFGAIPVRTNPDGSVVRVRDVGRTELGTETYDMQAAYNDGMPASGIAVRQAAGANALDTADAVKAKMEEMSSFFPEGMKVVYPYDTTPFTRVSIQGVVKTLLEAIVLVFLIMWLFLGNLRATFIPTMAVPVVILGTFGVLGLFGFSINMLTMFAMVLAIGLLVDDAIVVVENVERIMSEEGLSPREATAKSMDQITSALIGIGLVLSAVFGPMAFFPGSTGVIYRQFSITIISAMLLSVVVALILTPVLCASLLKPVKGGREAENAIFFLRPFFKWFNRGFFRFRHSYISLISHSLSRKKRYAAVFVIIVGIMIILFRQMPTSYIPDEDQGILLAQIIMPSGSTLEQTKETANQVRDYFRQNEKDSVESTMTIAGMSFSGRSQNNGMMFVKLKDWKLRDRDDLKAKAVAQRAMGALSGIKNAMVFVFPPPAVLELGMATGFDFQLLDRGGLGHQALMGAQYQLLGIASQDKRLTAVRPNSMSDVSEYRIDVDWDRAGALGVPITSIHRTLSAAFGSAYVNDFIQGGRVKRVFLQADAPHRMLPEDLDKLHVRNIYGKMVPFSSFASGKWTSGPPQLARFNSFPSINIWGEPAPGRSSGEAMRIMEEAVAKLPNGIGYDWTGLSYQERMSSSQAPMLYAFSIFVIFLCLAALYESWTIPISVLMVLPLGVIGGIIASSMRGLENDVYFQIGLLTTLGLTTKNAILIVQFAKDGLGKGMGLVEATIEGAKLRFRPILMTSLAFGFGVLPLAMTTGAGAGAQNAIGTSVLGGMISATVLVVIFAPLFYVLVEKILGKKRKTIEDNKTAVQPEEK